MAGSPYRVGVVGAGQMGRWIALRFAIGGGEVTLVDENKDALDRARSWIEGQRKPPVGGAHDEVLARICYVTGTIGQGGDADTAIANAALVVEAVPENKGLKTRVLAAISGVAAPQALLGTTASSIIMDEVDGGCTRHRGRTMNLHFFPPPRRSVELMAGTGTTLELLEEVAPILRERGFIPFLVRKRHRGFIFNQLWHLVKAGVLKQIATGVATCEDIDRLWILNFGMAMGPCAIMDLVGLDVVLAVEQVYAEDSGDPRDQPSQFLIEWAAAGRLGRKSGQGFYQYPNPAFEQPGWLDGEVDRGLLFRGTWRLMSFVVEDAAGNALGFPMGPDAQGTLIYTPTDVAVFLQHANRPVFSSPDPLGGTDPERVAGFDTAISYFGEYRVDEGVIHHMIRQCTFPNWKDTTQTRHYRFDAGRLILETPLMPRGTTEVRYRLVWERK